MDKTDPKRGENQNVCILLLSLKMHDNYFQRQGCHIIYYITLAIWGKNLCIMISKRKKKKASLPVNQSTLLPISTGMNVIFSGTMGRTKSCLQWGEELMMI